MGAGGGGGAAGRVRGGGGRAVACSTVEKKRVNDLPISHLLFSVISFRSSLFSFFSFSPKAVARKSNHGLWHRRRRQQGQGASRRCRCRCCSCGRGAIECRRRRRVICSCRSAQALARRARARHDRLLGRPHFRRKSFSLFSCTSRALPRSDEKRGDREPRCWCALREANSGS